MFSINLNNIFKKKKKQYTEILNCRHYNNISQLEKVKINKTLHSDLAILELGTHYLIKKDVKRAIHIYELLIASKRVHYIYRDYAELILIKIKIASKEIKSSLGVKIHNNFYKNAKYLNSLGLSNNKILFNV